MRLNRLTERESLDLVNYQISSFGISIAQGHYRIEDIGDILPGAVMVQDLSAPKLTYMNTWGCEKLDHSLDDLVLMGDEYYKKFFIEEECKVFLPGMTEYVTTQDPTSIYRFYQTVKTGPSMEPAVYYTTAKLLCNDHPGTPASQLIVVANPLPGIPQTISKLSKLVKENEYAERNHNKFLVLTKREKDIICLLAEGKSSREISDTLFLSSHTVNTHRKNIARKLDINSSAELFKFANAFDLVRY